MAAVPETEAQLKTLATVVVKAFEQVRMLGSVNSTTQSGTMNVTNIVAMQATVDAALVGTNLPTSASLFKTARANIVAYLRASAAAFANQFVEYGKVLGWAGDSFTAQFSNVFINYSQNAKAVQSRGFVFGTPSFTGTGSGALVRQNLDQYGNVLENQTADAKYGKCVFDANSSALIQEEVFSLQGATAGRDGLEEYGSGKGTSSSLLPGGGPDLVGISARNSQQFGIGNASFSSTTPVAAGATTVYTSLTAIGSWTLGTGSFAGTNVQVSALTGVADTDYYRAFQGDASPTSLRFTMANWAISQNLTQNGAQFDKNTCYYIHLAVRRVGAATGTITLQVGSKSVSLDISTLVAATWTLLKITGTAAWYQNFGGSSVSASVTMTGATGSCDIDDFTVGAYQSFDQGLYALVGGITPFKVNDSCTFTDTECGSSGRTTETFSVLQKWLWRIGVYLPAAPLAPTVAPTAALSGVAGVVTAGNHYYFYSYVDAFGRESSLSPVSAVVNADGTHKVAISALPAAPPSNIATLKIYSTLTGAASNAPAYYTGTSVNAGVTTATPNAADGALLVASVAGITWADPT